MAVLTDDHQQSTGTGFVDLLEIERDRLQNSCTHLERSNVELREAMQETGPDSDFQEAVEASVCDACVLSTYSTSPCIY